MKIHNFRLFIETSTTFIRPAVTSHLYVYGYERHPDWTNSSSQLNDIAMRLLTVQGGISGNTFYVAIGLLRRIKDAPNANAYVGKGASLFAGFEQLNLTDVRVQVFDFLGNTRQQDYLLHIRGIRQRGLVTPYDLSASIRVPADLQSQATQSYPTSLFIPTADAELLLLVLPTDFSGYNSGQVQGAIIMQISASVCVERELYHTPDSLCWCIYHVTSAAHHQPVTVLQGSGVVSYNHAASPQFNITLSISE